MSETELLHQIMLELSRDDIRLWRNNVGVLQDLRGNHVRYGLAPGSCDLIGLRSLIVTPEMIGRRLAIFVGIEGKSGRGRLSEAQALFLDQLRSLGALHGIARSVVDARRILEL